MSTNHNKNNSWCYAVGIEKNKILKGIQRTRKNASFYSHTQKKNTKKIVFSDQYSNWSDEPYHSQLTTMY